MPHASPLPKSNVKNENFAHPSLGEQLETKVWAEMKALNFTYLEKTISPSFQSIHQDGPRNNVGELALIKNLHLGNYALSNIKSSQVGDTIVVTYTATTEETIDGRQLTKKPSYRMSVWKKNGEGEWQWLSHANLISLGNR